MQQDQQVAISLKRQLRANKKWLTISVLAGFFPISADYLQSIIPEAIFLGSPVVAWLLIIILPMAVCFLGLFKLPSWWKLVPLALLIFNAILIYLLIALIMWSRTARPI